MISFKTVVAICLGATLCAAETINISGVVQDTDGVPISGAMVKLEQADLSATTGADGAFTLGQTTSTKPFAEPIAMAAHAVEFRNGKIAFTLSGNTSVGITIHDVGGRRIFSVKRTLGSGAHAISVPMQTAGIFLCNVTIGNEAYSFKASAFGASSMQSGDISRGTSALAKQAKATAVISDVIAATKTGWLNYRSAIGNSDTSGVVITMIANAGDVTDADGNVYQSVRIGNQVWMVENLRTTKYNDGTAIPHVTDPGIIFGTTGWRNLTTDAYCYYDNNSANKDKCGALYNWYAVNTGKLAPEGWHVPTEDEWTTLENHLIANGYNWDGTTSGNKIAKSIAARMDWTSDTTAGAIGNDLGKNNASGFSALPCGQRREAGDFSYLSYGADWWTTTETMGSTAYTNFYLYFAKECLSRSYGYETNGCSVRLVKDN